MITKLTLKNYRGFRDVTLDGLKRVNLLTGVNNSGKTGVLEALCLLLGDLKLVNALPTLFRANPTGGAPQSLTDDFRNYWLWLIHTKDMGKPALIESVHSNRGVIRFTFPEHNQDLPPQPSVIVAELTSGNGSSLWRVSGKVELIPPDQALARPIPRVVSIRPSHPVEDAKLFNEVSVKRSGEERMEELMRHLEPRLKRLRYAQLPDYHYPLVYVDIGLDEALPSTMMGQAFSRAFHIFCQILARKADVLLIDEIENGMHWSALPDFWKGLAAVAESENMQIFATTHSRECVTAAHQAFAARSAYDLALYRLDRMEDNIRVVQYDHESLEGSIQFGMEMR